MTTHDPTDRADADWDARMAEAPPTLLPGQGDIFGGTVTAAEATRTRQLEVARKYLASKHVTLWHDWIITDDRGMANACAFIVDLFDDVGLLLAAARFEE